MEIVRNLEGFAGSILVVSRHLVRGEAEGRGLERNEGGGGAQVKDREVIRRAVMAEVLSGCPEDQYRSFERPLLVGGPEGRADPLISL